MTNFTRFLILLLTAFACIGSYRSSAQCTMSNPAGCFCPEVGATNCLLIPDIIAGKKTLNATTGWTEYNQMITGVDKGLLRIDVSTPNVGWGPLEVAPTNDYVCGGDTIRDFFPPPTFMCPDGSYPKRLIKQRIYHKKLNTFQYDLRDAGWMQYHPAHGHIHIEGWGLYTLRLKDPTVMDTLQWPIVNSGVKVSFCLIDLTTCSGSLGDCRDANGNILNNGSFPNYGLGGGYDCGNTRQGISVGKVDIYHQYLDESFVKIPYEACNGTYQVMVQIDPDNHFLEMNEENNWLVAQVPLTKQRTTNTGPYAYIFSKTGNIMCTGQSLLLEASGANNYVWSNGATTQKTTVTQPGKYWVRATTPCGVATSDTLTIIQASPNGMPAEIKEDTVCMGEKAHLYASGNAHWFDAPVNGNLIFIGNDFETGSLLNNTTFYVADQLSLIKTSMGPATTTFSGNGNYTNPRSDYTIFNAYLPFNLKRITVDASTAGTRTIELRDQYGRRIAAKTVSLAVGTQEILIDFFVPAGLNHQLGLASGSAANLYSSTTTNANIGYPFKVNSIAHIVGSSKGDQVFPFAYNWKVEVTPQACNAGLRRPVTAYVVPKIIPQINGLNPVYHHIDNGQPFTVSPPGGTLTGNGIIGNYFFYPKIAGIGTHPIKYTFSNNGCISEVTQFVTVDFDTQVLDGGFWIQLFNNAGPRQRLYVVSEQSSKLEVRLLSNTGQLLQLMNYDVLNGSTIFDLDFSKFAKGLYILDVRHLATGRNKILKLLN